MMSDFVFRNMPSVSVLLVLGLFVAAMVIGWRSDGKVGVAVMAVGLGLTGLFLLRAWPLIVDVMVPGAETAILVEPAAAEGGMARTWLMVGMVAHIVAPAITAALGLMIGRGFRRLGGAV